MFISFNLRRNGDITSKCWQSLSDVNWRNRNNNLEVVRKFKKQNRSVSPKYLGSCWISTTSIQYINDLCNFCFSAVALPEKYELFENTSPNFKIRTNCHQSNFFWRSLWIECWSATLIVCCELLSLLVVERMIRRQRVERFDTSLFVHDPMLDQNNQLVLNNNYSST